jgi:hypothetical protein
MRGTGTAETVAREISRMVGAAASVMPRRPTWPWRRDRSRRRAHRAPGSRP